MHFPWRFVSLWNKTIFVTNLEWKIKEEKVEQQQNYRFQTPEKTNTRQITGKVYLPCWIFLVVSCSHWQYLVSCLCHINWWAVQWLICQLLAIYCFNLQYTLQNTNLHRPTIQLSKSQVYGQLTYHAWEQRSCVTLFEWRGRSVCTPPFHSNVMGLSKREERCTRLSSAVL